MDKKLVYIRHERDEDLFEYNYDTNGNFLTRVYLSQNHNNSWVIRIQILNDIIGDQSYSIKITPRPHQTITGNLNVACDVFYIWYRLQLLSVMMSNYSVVNELTRHELGIHEENLRYVENLKKHLFVKCPRGGILNKIPYHIEHHSKLGLVPNEVKLLNKLYKIYRPPYGK